MIGFAFRIVDGVLRRFFDLWVRTTEGFYDPPEPEDEGDIVLIPVEVLAAFVDALQAADQPSVEDQDRLDRAAKARWN